MIGAKVWIKSDARLYKITHSIQANKLVFINIFRIYSVDLTQALLGH